jgi:hypothetical protein
VRFETNAGTQDASAGTQAESPSTLCTRWAALLPLSDGAFDALRAQYGGAAWGAAVRYDTTSATIAAGQTMVWIAASRTFEVVGALDPDGRHEWIHVALNERGVARVVSP